MNQNRSKLQHNSNWVTMIITVIAVAIVFNLVVDLIVNKFPVKIDLTPHKIFSLTDATKTELSKLDKDIHIIVFSTETTKLPYIQEILDRYKRESARISWEVIDPVRNPSYTSKYSTVGNTLMPNSVVVECGNKFKLLQPYDIFPMDSQGNVGATINAEGMLTSAIVYVTSDKNIKVGFVSGHSESNIADSPLGITLKNQNFDYEQVSLAGNEVPNDIDYLIIAGARTDFQPAEIDHLDNFLRKGKAVQMLYAIDAPALPKLDSYLDEWGIVVNRDIVKEQDTSNIMGNNPNQIIAQYMPSEITNNMIQNQLPTVLPMVRSITTKWEDQYNVKLESLIQSSSSSYAKNNPLSTKTDKEEGDTSGPLNLAVLATRTLENNNEPVQAGNLLVIGTANLYDEKFLDYNTPLLINAISSQTRTGQSVAVQPKSMESALKMNMTNIILCSIIVIFVIPLSILIWGLIVWIRRRNL